MTINEKIASFGVAEDWEWRLVGEMSWITEIKNLKPTALVASVFVFMSTVSPGFLILYHYKPDLIEKLDIVKIIIFSLALTLPVFAANFFWINELMIRFPFPEGFVEDMKSLAMRASILTIGVLYLSLYVTWFWHLNLRIFTFMVFFGDIFFLFSLMLFGVVRKAKASLSKV